MKRFVFLTVVFVGYCVFFVRRFPLQLPFFLFTIGAAIGYGFHLIDRIAQLFFRPELSVQKKHFFQLIAQLRVFAGLNYLMTKIPSLSMGFIFLALYFPLAFYLVSSSGSVLGTGVVLGLGLSYCAHFVLNYQNIKDARELHFQPVNKTVSDQMIQRVMGGFIALFVLLSIFVIF